MSPTAKTAGDGNLFQGQVRCGQQIQGSFERQFTLDLNQSLPGLALQRSSNGLR